MVIASGPGGHFLQESITALEMFGGTDKAQAGDQRSGLDGSELQGLCTGPQLGRHVLQGVGDEDDGLLGFLDDVQQGSGPAPVRGAVQVVHFIEQNQFSLCPKERCGECRRAGDPFQGRFRPLV
jgi:hypothetical protein